MRVCKLLSSILALVLVGPLVPLATAPAGAQPSSAPPITENPIPAPVEKQGLAIEIRDFVRLPRTLGLLPEDRDVNPAGYARVSFVVDAPDGRRFANDQRGLIYLLREGVGPSLYLDFRSAFPHTLYNRLESGLIGFAFHPEFAENGLFYTVHVEDAEGNPARPDFIPPGYGEADVTHHNVITEWRANDPAASVFEGSHRELLRVAHVVMNASHPVGFVGFNPTASPGDEDYGLLYTSGSDLGFSNGGGPNANNPTATQRLDSVVTAILRIDPRSPAESGGTKGLGDYTIPPGNPYANDGDPATLGEIYAHGFRNAHRISWDLNDGTMFVGDIGMSNIEEIDIVHAGANYGWMAREGYWENGMIRPGGALNQLYPLPDDVLDGRTADPFTYPVAMYDHDEGRAITAGFAYHGPIEALQGKFLFGDIQNGRLFAADLDAVKAADDGVPRTVAPIEEVQLFVRDAEGNREDVSFLELVERAKGEQVTRADLQLSRGSDGTLFLTSRQDGWIRVLASPSSGPTSQASSPPPDLSGVWMAFAVENPDGGGNTPRYSTQGRAKLDAFAAQFSSIPETGAFCLPTGMPSMMLSTVSYPVELVQTRSRLVMLAELEMQVRRVFLDGREHPDDFLPTSVGHSIGTWEGDTLVVDTALLEEWPLGPWPRSDQTHIVERLHLTKLADVDARPTGFVATVEPPINDDVLVVELTVSDPTLYDGPQRRIAYYQRMADSATLEYLCTAELWREELEKNRVSK